MEVLSSPAVEVKNCWPDVVYWPTADQARSNQLFAARELDQLVELVEPIDAPPLRLAWAARGAMNVVTPEVALGRAGDLRTARTGIALAIARLRQLDQVLITQARG